MTTYFLDASALVKRYLAENGSGYIFSIVDPSLLHTIILAEITRVEVAAAIAARQRAASRLTLKERDEAVGLMLRHCNSEYRMVPLTPTILGRRCRIDSKSSFTWLRRSAIGNCIAHK